VALAAEVRSHGIPQRLKPGSLLGLAARVELVPFPVRFSVFSRKLFTNERTPEKWEQRRAKPNAQAAACCCSWPSIRTHLSGWSRWRGNLTMNDL